MTSYDTVWKTFLNNYKVPDGDLPKTDEKMYEHIRNAVLHFNNRMRVNASCDDTLEVVVNIDSEDDLLILAHYIKLVFLKNDKKYYESLWQPFSSDVGLRNFGTQLTSLKTSVQEQEDFIEQAIFNAMEDFL